MASIKSNVLNKSEEIYALLFECPGFTIQSEVNDHMVIRCPGTNQARQMARLLRSLCTSCCVTGDSIRAEYQLH